MRHYTVVLTPEPDGSAYNVVVPSLPGCFTRGTAVDEARAMARGAIATYLDGEDAADWPAPGEQVVAEVTVDVEEAGGVLRARHVAAAV